MVFGLGLGDGLDDMAVGLGLGDGLGDGLEDGALPLRWSWRRGLEDVSMFSLLSFVFSC